MSVVTISREYGSAGNEVARKLAALLGYHLVDKSVIGNILAGYGLIDFDKMYEIKPPSIWSPFYDKEQVMISMLKRLAFAAVRHGHSVIVGRGAYLALSGVHNVLNVRLRAPFDWRVDRTMHEEGMKDRPQAEAAVREGDKVSSSFISSVYGARWDSMEHFDLVIDTSRIGPDKAASLLAEFVRDVPVVSSGQVLAEPDDPIMDEAVATELGCTKGETHPEK